MERFAVIALGPRLRRSRVRQPPLGRQPKDGDPRGGFAVLEATGAGVEARIERCRCDAELASREVAAAGLAGEFAGKLPIAA